jgi:hypothetical protein
VAPPKLEAPEVRFALVSWLLRTQPSQIDYRPPHLHLPGSLPTSSPTLPISADRHTQPHASGSRITASSSPYTAQSPIPRKRLKVDDHSSAATSPVSAAFTPRSDSDPSHSSRTLHSRVQPPPPPPPPPPPLPPPPYQPGFFPGFSSHVSPTIPSGSAGGLHTPASFPSPTGLSAPPLHLMPPYGSPRHPPRISQPLFGSSVDDLFANVFGPAGSGGVGFDPEFDFLAPPLTFDWPQFAPPTQAGGGGNGQQGHPTGDPNSSSWLDFLSGAGSDAPRSPRTGKRSRGDAQGGSGEEDGRGAAGGGG